jgi:hypothetical protein
VVPGVAPFNPVAIAMMRLSVAASRRLVSFVAAFAIPAMRPATAPAASPAVGSVRLPPILNWGLIPMQLESNDSSG